MDTNENDRRKTNDELRYLAFFFIQNLIILIKISLKSAQIGWFFSEISTRHKNCSFFLRKC